MESDQQLADECVTVTEFIPPEKDTILLPVTIFQILQEGNSLIREGKDETCVILAAHVKRVEILPAKVSLALEDGTGLITATRKYVSLTSGGGKSAEAEKEEKSLLQAFEHTYVMLTAKLTKNVSGRAPWMEVRTICPVDDYHQVMYHTLLVIHSNMHPEQFVTKPRDIARGSGDMEGMPVDNDEISALSIQHEPGDSVQNFGDMEGMLVDDDQVDENSISIQRHNTSAVSAPLLPSTFSPQKHQPYATLGPLERAIMKYVHNNQPILIAELARAIGGSFGYTESQFNLAVYSLLSEAYITSPLDDGYVVVTPRH